MDTLKRYSTAWKRFCRSHGFGIHSPFAYNFVVDVIRQRHPYYAYDVLEQMRRQIAPNHFNPRHILQIGSSYGLSAAATLLPDRRSRLWLHEPDSERHTTLNTTLHPFAHRIIFDDSIVNITTNYSAAIEESQQNPFVVVNNIHNAESYSQLQFYVNSVLADHGVIVFRNIATQTLVAQLCEESKQYAMHGMSFGNHRTIVFVADKKLPRQDFSLWL